MFTILQVQFKEFIETKKCAPRPGQITGHSPCRSSAPNLREERTLGQQERPSRFPESLLIQREDGRFLTA